MRHDDALGSERPIFPRDVYRPPLIWGASTLAAKTLRADQDSSHIPALLLVSPSTIGHALLNRSQAQESGWEVGERALLAEKLTPDDRRATDNVLLVPSAHLKKMRGRANFTMQVFALEDFCDDRHAVPQTNQESHLAPSTIETRSSLHQEWQYIRPFLSALEQALQPADATDSAHHQRLMLDLMQATQAETPEAVIAALTVEGRNDRMYLAFPDVIRVIGQQLGEITRHVFRTPNTLQDLHNTAMSPDAKGSREEQVRLIKAMNQAAFSSWKRPPVSAKRLNAVLANPDVSLRFTGAPSSPYPFYIYAPLKQQCRLFFQTARNAFGDHFIHFTVANIRDETRSSLTLRWADQPDSSVRYTAIEEEAVWQWAHELEVSPIATVVPDSWTREFLAGQTYHHSSLGHTALL